MGVAIFFAVGLLYFALFGRHRLVFSPEEEFALTHGVHGHPETEGYDVTERLEEQAGPPRRVATPSRPVPVFRTCRRERQCTARTDAS